MAISIHNVVIILAGVTLLPCRSPIQSVSSIRKGHMKILVYVKSYEAPEASKKLITSPARSISCRYLDFDFPGRRLASLSRMFGSLETCPTYSAGIVSNWLHKRVSYHPLSISRSLLFLTSQFLTNSGSMDFPLFCWRK